MKHPVLLAALVLLTTVATLGATDREAELLQQGKAYFAAGKYQKAAQSYEQAARINPRSTRALNGAGMSYQRLGANEVMVNEELLEQAVAAFTRVLSIDSAQAETRYNLGMTYLALHRKEEAVKQCDALKGLDKALAQTLSARIGEYRPAKKYRSVGGGGDRQPAKGRRDGAGPGAGSPAPRRFAGTVEVYGADWCPSCRAANRYMTEKGIRFVYHDIEADAAAKSAYQGLGGGGIPLIVIGSRKMHGFSASWLEYHLNNSP